MLCLDGVDGTVPRIRRDRREDHLSQQEMWSETWQLRLGRREMRLQGMGGARASVFFQCNTATHHDFFGRDFA